MSLADTVAEGRAAAEELMTDACVITRGGTGEPVYDPATDTTSAPADDTVYDDPDTPGAGGICRAKPADTVDLAQDAGEAVVGARRYVVSIPLAATAPRRNDFVLMTASLLDPALPGTRFRVLGAAKGSQLTARRLACEEVTG